MAGLQNNKDCLFAQSICKELKANNKEAILELYHAFHPFFLAFTRRRLFNPDPNQIDTVLSTFWTALLNGKAICGFKGKSSLRTFLLTILIHYGLNDPEIIKKSVMLSKKAQPQGKTVPHPTKRSVGSPHRQKDIHPALPDTHKKYETKEYINSVKPLYEGKPDASKVRSPGKSRIPRTPLERIHLSQFKLVGIVVSADGNKALLEGASGKGYVVRVGAYIGTNAGKIVQIQKDRIVIEEQIEDTIGKVEIRKIELKLYSK